jgi:ankyrin repeat protein
MHPHKFNELKSIHFLYIFYLVYIFKDGKSALLWACEKGSDDIAELLIKKGSILNPDEKV